jgi:hypothetical protein
MTAPGAWWHDGADNRMRLTQNHGAESICELAARVCGISYCKQSEGADAHAGARSEGPALYQTLVALVFSD